jgi:hypothetical protein
MICSIHEDNIPPLEKGEMEKIRNKERVGVVERSI